MKKNNLRLICALLLSVALMLPAFTRAQDAWKPVVDWGHWRLGQKADLEFLQTNNMTITFGSGAPNFEGTSREVFDKKMEEAKTFNKSYHDKGYIMLRYLSTSLSGKTATNKDIPEKDQIEMLEFYNENWTDYIDYIGPKPEADPTTWIMVRPDGTFPFYRYAPYGREVTEEFETWGCPDNPDYVRMMEGHIRAQAETGIDGSYVDWTQIAGGTCYCDYTRKNFIANLKENLPSEVGKAKYGTSDYDNIQLPQKRGDKFWMEWLLFRGHAVAEFHKKLRTAAREVNPNFMIAGNVFGGFGYGPIAYDAAGNMEFLGADGYDDFIYSEMQEFLDSAPRKDSTGMKITNSPALKFLTSVSHQKPVIVYATEITPPIFPDPTEKCLSAMAQINIAEAEANHTIFREKRQTPPGAAEMYQFLSENEENLLGAKLHSNIAILTSLRQYLADELSFAFSASRVLADRGISHVMIIEDDLINGNLSQYDLVLVPYLPLLNIEKQEALKKFVENGGTLLVLGKSGSKGDFNLPNSRNVLTEMSGTANFQTNYTEKKLGKGTFAFVPLTIPANRFLIYAKAKSDATTFGPSMADVFSDIPEGYTRGRIDPSLRTILESAADKIEVLQRGKISRLVKKTPFVEMTTMQQSEKNRMLVHLVNYDVTVDGTITPANNLQVQVLIPDGKKVKQVSYNGLLGKMTPTEFKSQVNDGRQIVTFQPEVVNVYGLAVIELE